MGSTSVNESYFMQVENVVHVSSESRPYPVVWRTTLNFKRLLFVALTTLVNSSTLRASEFPPERQPNVAQLMASTRYVRELDEGELIKLVPAQSGLHFVDCPNCDSGRREQQLTWSSDRPEEVVCQFCKHRYPSEKYPMSACVQVKTPSGTLARFPYWQDDKGYRYFFQAKRDDEARVYVADRARDLALLYVATQDPQHARRSAIILDRFAQVFPDWCYHYDYPFQQKKIYDGVVTPSDFRSSYRTARWSWWAYKDIPLPLVQAFDWIRKSDALGDLSRERGVDCAARIERDLIRNACSQVIANPETLTNMSPTAWRSLVYAGRVLREPSYVHEVSRRLSRLIGTRFFYDGTWCEGTPDYASQTVGGLQQVLGLLQGYSDPADYVDPIDGMRFDNLNLNANFPGLRMARDVLQKWRLPNGRGVPVHDAWSTSRRFGYNETQPYLLPALGHACLGGGMGHQQTQFHLTWSGGYGHSHADNLSLLLYSRDRELLSDLGYTHTAYRAWTLTSAAHNTVVIDGCNQSMGGRGPQTDGRLLEIDLQDPRVQYVVADGSRGYPQLAEQYTRHLIVVDAGEGRRYAIDRFDVTGGSIHDYFLHGDADDNSALLTDVPLRKLGRLLPDGFQWTPTRNEGDISQISKPWYAYGFLNNLKTAELKPRVSPSKNDVSLIFQMLDNSGNESTVKNGLAAVRVILLPESDSQLVVGENPSIRPADEDDSKLNDYQRPFLMVRRRASDGHSRFLSIIEPYTSASAICDVQQLNVGAGNMEATALCITCGDRTDWIVLSAKQPVEIPIGPGGDDKAHFMGALGFLSVRNEKVDYAYVMGDGNWKWPSGQISSDGHSTARLLEVIGNSLIISQGSATAPRPGSVVRLVTADNWCYPFTVKDVTTVGETFRVNVVEAPALKLDASCGRLELITFPGRQHNGEINVQWSHSRSAQF
jgi:hypothetical protein